MKIMHHSRSLLVAQIDPSEVGYVTSIPQYLIIPLPDTGRGKVGGWTDAFNAINIAEELEG